MSDRHLDHDEKVRLDNLRLECLKLAARSDDVSMNRVDIVPQAEAYFDYVTDAPQRPELFAVKRMDDPEPGEHPTLGPLDYLGTYAGVMKWDHEYNAYRFRSKAEAEAAIAKYQAHLGGVMLPVPLPSYMDLF